MQKEITSLLKSFVECPSWVDSKVDQNESKLGQLVIEWIKNNLPEYRVRKIKIGSNRFNILAVPKKPLILFACHLDTTPPIDSKTIKFEKRGDRLYGLGSKDMKGGIIACLLAVKELPSAVRSKTGFLFYCDEEYNQLGMSEVVRNSSVLSRSIKVLISPESRFNLAYSCRGYAVVEVVVAGKRAHTARPQLGVNAIERALEVIKRLQSQLEKKTELGKTMVIPVGLRAGVKTLYEKVSVQSNSVPDCAVLTLGIRIADKKLTEARLVRTIKNADKALESVRLIVFRKPSTTMNPRIVRLFSQAIKRSGFSLELAKPGLGGYNDLVMLSNKIRKPFLGFGPYGEGNHSSNEQVSLNSILDTIKVFKDFITNFS